MSPRSFVLAATAALVLSGAIIQEPAEAQTPIRVSSRKAKAPVVPACRVRVVDVHDLRSDTTSMGTMGYKLVHSNDPPAWVRASLLTLADQKTITFVDSAADADLEIDTDILKAYIFTITSAKAATVVLRIRYSHAGAPVAEQIYRGAKNGVNWANTNSETQGALNLALADAVKPIGVDIARLCGQVRATPAPTSAS